MRDPGRPKASDCTKLLLGMAIFATPIPQQAILAPVVVPEV
jgi:hypothetical protein